MTVYAEGRCCCQTASLNPNCPVHGHASSNRAATCERCGGAKFIRAAGDAGRTVRAACPDCAPPEWMPGHRHHVDTRGDSGLYFCLVCGEDFTSRPDDTVECPGPGRAIPNRVQRIADAIRPALNIYPDGVMRVSHGQEDIAETVVRLVLEADAILKHVEASTPRSNSEARDLDATRNRVAEMRDRIQYLLDDGWPAEDIAAQVADEFAT